MIEFIRSNGGDLSSHHKLSIKYYLIKETPVPTEYEIVEKFMADAREIVEELEYNENLSSIPEIKIIFNAYGDDDELGESMDKNIETYYMFVHKNTLESKFIFPEHKLLRGSIVHESDEVYIPAIYNVEEGYWDINFIGLDENSAIDDESLRTILQKLYEKYYG